MIYLDHASTTAVDPRVAKKMLPYFSDKFGNPSSLHSVGRKAKQAIEDARRKIAKFLNCATGEITFTNGGTESINMAILGVAHAAKSQNKFKKPRIIITAIEHHAVLHSCDKLISEGFEVYKLPVDQDGFVNLNELKKALNNETILVSVMYANNEIGTIEPISKISKIIKEFNKKNKTKIIFHSDACQAAGYLDMNVKALGVDLLSFNGSKIYGPKGIGVLYKEKNIELEPIIFGGGQERNLRSGTENVPAIVGLGFAVELISREESEKIVKLRDFLIKKLLEIEGAVLNGPIKDRLANNVNVSFAGVEGESMVLYLDRAGICCSTGSACSSSSLKPSHVITALGHDGGRAHESIRFTLGRKTGKKELERTVCAVRVAVEKLRRISALK